MISAIITVLAIYSCQESLGVNNTKYLQNSMIDTLSRDTIIVDYKKIVITYYVIEHDTVKVYDTIPMTRNPVFAKGYNITMMETFIDSSSYSNSYVLPHINYMQRSATIEYNNSLSGNNNFLPVINLNLDIANSDTNLLSYPLRTELLSRLSLSFNNLQFTADMFQAFNDLYFEKQMDINLIYKTKSGSNFPINKDNIIGTVYFSDRRVVKGQLASITLNISIYIPTLYPKNGLYAINLILTLDFPIS